MAEKEIFERDLVVMRAMVDHVASYLASDANRWDMGTPGMPPMTIGGILMRRERLGLLDERLSLDQRRQRDETNRLFDDALVEAVVRFEQRAHTELHARLREWTNYLRDLPSRSAAQPSIYAYVADTRVVIGVLVDKLRESPYQLKPQVNGDIIAVDKRLRSLWDDGPFIWDPAWAVAYPVDRFWYLYGGPKSA